MLYRLPSLLLNKTNQHRVNRLDVEKPKHFLVYSPLQIHLLQAMAPKRKKAQSIIDISLGSDSDDSLEDKKRRRASSTRRKPVASAADAEEALASSRDGGGEHPTSQCPSTGNADAPRGGKRKTKKAEAPEKEHRVDCMGRIAKYRSTPSREVYARIQRAMPGSAHRMFLVDSKQLSAPGSSDGPAQEFHVLGATGNVYTVVISRSPSCSCPDFAKGHLCKHVLFVMLRVLRQSPDNPVIWQKGLLTREVEEVLGPLAAAGSGTAAVDQSVLATELVRQRYAAVAGGSSSSGAAGAASGGGGVQRPVEGDCPICYEAMVAPSGGGRGAEANTFCMSCGNNMHKTCFDRWASSKRSSGQVVTCVYCRAAWGPPGASFVRGGAAGDTAAGSAGGSAGEYVNLSQYSDAHRNAPSLEELYGANAYFIRANNGDMSRREAARLHAAARGLA
ncbi:hypothetical protein VOLCADRAFT_103541 [Volvox carteri f. nagariensis]|uniref:SWIM-type domain-containing protein n=1 Tax=Volvox carteri f. nagariensis TaxID=3068 RepID=D8TML0_VOLCA|nr:uncharacterized protein VOLCADRAFT_103541 [Volvox carteri f. nagariensis]EFJ51142.1 hypothetical protein VOLCADRAFT_103541 [Volvox carteri f. nagariensis]|eukprot:XP_002947609.1 hypothetical protein VOLCADRAFT_103541 [Volvox carteri f. nagariensis]